MNNSPSSGGVPVLLQTPHIPTAMEPPPVYQTSPLLSLSLTNQTGGESLKNSFCICGGGDGGRSSLHLALTQMGRDIRNLKRWFGFQ